MTTLDLIRDVYADRLLPDDELCRGKRHRPVSRRSTSSPVRLVHSAEASASDRLDDASSCLVGRLVFPHPNDRPPFLSQRVVDSSIALDVPGELWAPVVVVRLGRAAVFGAAVPEAAVQEDSDASRAEDGVRPRANVASGYESVLPEPEPCVVQGGSQLPFRRSVERAVRPHDHGGGRARGPRVRGVARPHLAEKRTYVAWNLMSRGHVESQPEGWGD
jgi:hypothetical protein